MRIGDIVRSRLSDQIGIVIAESNRVYSSNSSHDSTEKPHSFQVIWSTKGNSMWGAGSSEWVGDSFIEVISESR